MAFSGARTAKGGTQTYQILASDPREWLIEAER